MHRNRSRGARNNRHRRSFEEMLDVVTSTPAGEGRLGYQDFSEDTSDTSDYTYDPDDDSEADYEYTYGDVEHTYGGPREANGDRIQSGVRQVTQRGVNSQEELNDTRDTTDYEWDELQDAHYEEEDELLVANWEKLCSEAKSMRRWAKTTIAKELREFQAYMEEERHPRDIEGRKTKAKNDLHDVAVIG